MFNQQVVFETLMSEVHSTLESAPKYDLYSKEWYSAAPSRAGVYFVWRESELVYVGETSNIKKRMGDLKKTLNHTLRRKIGKEYFSTHKEYLPATSKKKFSEVIEIGITNYCMEKLKVSYFPLSIGRKEVEESFVLGDSRPQYNSPNKRGVKTNLW